MAIAPLPQQEQFELLEIPWPKPALRLVPSMQPASVRHSVTVDPSPDVLVELKRVNGTTPRNRSRKSAVLRRRRMLVGASVVAALLVLSLPIQALGGKTVTGQSALSGVTSGLPDGSIYVVQSGDTVSSIAHRINPDGDQAALVRALRTTVGSPVVVPGEHIVLP